VRLLEAIVEANHAAVEGRRGEVNLADHAGALPLAALTCIDARLNKLFPGALGVTEEEFVWLRDAGNVITSPTSSTVRSIALSVFVKGAKEIAVIGHTDCKLSKLSMMDFLARLQEHGIDRTRLDIPNLHEFFGLFSSETQNVIKGCGYLRQSPVIPPKIPVHGLVINTSTGRLEWVVNGYENLSAGAVPGVSLKELVTDQLPANTPSLVSGTLGAIAEKFEPLVAQTWEAATAKVAEKVSAAAAAKLPPKLKPQGKTRGPYR